jgi:hypothetical protein
MSSVTKTLKKKATKDQQDNAEQLTETNPARRGRALVNVNGELATGHPDRPHPPPSTVNRAPLLTVEPGTLLQACSRPEVDEQTNRPFVEATGHAPGSDCNTLVFNWARIIRMGAGCSGPGHVRLFPLLRRRLPPRAGRRAIPRSFPYVALKPSTSPSPTPCALSLSLAQLALLLRPDAMGGA